jgi:hypothetical protein
MAQSTFSLRATLSGHDSRQLAAGARAAVDTRHTRFDGTSTFQGSINCIKYIDLRGALLSQPICRQRVKGGAELTQMRRAKLLCKLLGQSDE